MDDISKEKENLKILFKKFENLEKNLPVVVKEERYDLFLQNQAFFDELIKILDANSELINEINIKFLLNLLNKKHSETRDKNAFAEYGALAQFLITIGESSLMIKDLKINNFNNEYLRLFRYVVEHAKDMVIGYSWNAYRIIKNQYNNISPINRDYIKSDKLINDELVRIGV